MYVILYVGRSVSTTILRMMKRTIKKKPLNNCSVCGAATTWNTGGVGWGACCRDKMVALINEWVAKVAIKNGQVNY